jgi:serine/threonine protein phosphatase PrpC
MLQLVRMGVYLSTPRTEKLSENGENERLKFGLSSMQGWRASMEDAVSFLTRGYFHLLAFCLHDGCSFILQNSHTQKNEILDRLTTSQKIN